MLNKPKKLCKDCGKNEPHTWRKICIPCINKIAKEKAREQQKKQKEKIVVRKQKALPKTNRQKSGEKEIFAEIWSERPHTCVICWKNIPYPLSFVFAHIKSKWVHPELKFEKSNIALVCSIDCHQKLDIRNSYKNAYSPNTSDATLSQ